MADEIMCEKCNAMNSSSTLYCSKCGTKLNSQDSSEEKDSFIGTFVGERFLVKRKIGEGGMGVVYEAEQTAIDRKVALKVLHPHLTDESLYARFRNEAAASSKLGHPNTITVYDFGRTENNSLYIAMEFINGISLDDEIKKNGPIQWQRACKIGKQICGSLRNAHDNGIIHRDMKPENVMLCPRGDELDFVKVLDFGIAKIIEDEGTDQRKALTKTGMVFGTPQYMSPEQVRGEKIDARSDIYSVGIILYEMLTGRIPFVSDTPMGLLTKHLLDEPPAFRKINPSVDVPAAFEKLVMQTLSKSADDRPSSMKELGNKLDEILGILHSGKTTMEQAHGAGFAQDGSKDNFVTASTEKFDSIEQTDPDLLAASNKKSPIGIIAALVIALFAVSGAAWFFLFGSKSDESPATQLAQKTGQEEASLEINDSDDENLSSETEEKEDIGDTQDEVAKESVTPKTVPTATTPGSSSGTTTSTSTGTTTKYDTDTNTSGGTGTTQPVQDTGSKTPDTSTSSQTGSSDTQASTSDKQDKPEVKKDADCVFSASGGRPGNLIMRSMRRSAPQITKCIETGSNTVTLGFSVKEGDEKFSSVLSISGNPNQVACIKDVFSAMTFVDASIATGSGKIVVSTEKDDVVSKCNVNLSFGN